VAILQAILSLIAKSAGKALNAIFGWAVLALFGQTGKSVPSLWLRKILLEIGGQAFSAMAADRIEFRRNDRLELAVLPSETVLTGRAAEVARARARALAEEPSWPIRAQLTTSGRSSTAWCCSSTVPCAARPRC
jgi:hypothetical protein